jgi:hypothetical protein
MLGLGGGGSSLGTRRDLPCPGPGPVKAWAIAYRSRIKVKASLSLKYGFRYTVERFPRTQLATRTNSTDAGTIKTTIFRVEVPEIWAMEIDPVLSVCDVCNFCNQNKGPSFLRGRLYSFGPPL